MIDFLYSIDLSIFYFINHGLSAGFADKFFSLITNVNNWYITYIILLGISFIKGGTRGKIAAVGVIFLIIVTDQTGAHLLKDLVQRVRPCNALRDVFTPLGCTGSFSFPSNHALNNFAAAVFYFRLFPKLKWVLFITASLVALSRIYLGLHYPSDVLGGAIMGIIFGCGFAELALLINNRYNKRSSSEKNK